ncbi:hypothetical protein MTO96_007271 [Rhipicephalus appendiculatus]
MREKNHSCFHWHGGRAAHQHLTQKADLYPKKGDDAGFLFNTAGMILTEAFIFFAYLGYLLAEERDSLNASRRQRRPARSPPGREHMGRDPV